jgi:hypothetical protein
MTLCKFDITVDRMIVSSNRSEAGGVCIRKCAARGVENVADAKVLNLRGGTIVKLAGSKVRGCLGRAASTLICDGIQHLALANRRYGHCGIGAPLSRAGWRAGSLRRR